MGRKKRLIVKKKKHHKKDKRVVKVEKDPKEDFICDESRTPMENFLIYASIGNPRMRTIYESLTNNTNDQGE